jgi:hypothetical protein
MLGQSQAMLYYNMARTYCRAGNSEKGIGHLIKAFNAGLYFSDRLEDEESFECLKTDRRFRGLLEAAKLVDFALRIEEGDPENELLVEAMEKACDLSPSYAYPPYILAKLYARRNCIDEALARLKKSMELGFKDYCAIVGDPAFAGIRALQEFQHLLRG